MTASVPHARRRATTSPPAPATAPGTGGPAAPGAAPGAERLAALLAETGPAAPGQIRAPGTAPSGTPPAHRRQVAARTRVPGTLLLIALAALAWLAWTVLAPGRDSGGTPDTAGRPVLAEAQLGGGTEEGTEHSGATGADIAAGAEPGTGTVLPGPSSAPTPSAGSTLYVHVTGEVARPGVVTLEAGARVVDAVEAAGGLTDAAVTDTVNLAAPVTDGQQVLVPDTDEAPGVPPAPGAPGAPPGPAPPDGAAPAAPLNLNTATAAELEALPRVGPVLAGRIVEFRQQHGGFAAVADLDAVPGIGPTLMEALVPLVTV
ncbi:helix-hairpin-helix domain-containing protein [Kocuria rhizosphaericola]|uniref:helix-hairpin-helix domain-containing protein n=1 Tax=Kocuria rhizosphaericola TaxID=3376284 RepID=UPI0037BD785C